MSDLQDSIFRAATSELVEWVARERSLDIKEAMRIVYESELYKKLQDPETGLYREGPLYLYDMIAEEKGYSRPS